MAETTVTEKTQRLLHLDLLRLLAIYLVIFNHTGSRGYMLFADSTDSPMYPVYMIFSVVCKIAVPLFFMISGALLLPKEESLKQLFSKRILRMTIVMILISVPYYIWLKRANGLSPGSFFTYIYSDSASTPLWYLYSYLALLLMLPFLRKMVRSMQHKDYLYLFVGHIILTGVLPCLEYCLWNGEITVHESFSPFLFTGQNVFFALMGYWLEHSMNTEKHTRKNIRLGIGFSAAAVLATCLITGWQISVIGGGSGNPELERFFQCFISVPAMTVYYLMKCAARKITHPKIRKWISETGGAVFGVYLIEKFIRALTDSVYVFCAYITGSFAASLLWALTVLCAGLLIVLVLKHLPFVGGIVKKFI